MWYGECAGRRAPMLAKEDLLAVPHRPTAAPWLAAPRTGINAAAGQKHLPRSRQAQPHVGRAARSRIGDMRAV